MNAITVKKLLNEFGVSSETELQEYLFKESETLPCQVCGKKVHISNVYFIDGDPTCYQHYKESKRYGHR